jgi:DNA modification methylase
VIDFGVVNAGDPDRFHPTQKPVDLCEYLIATFSNPGDTVLDPCAGSGTTGVAALRTGRRFVGFEITPEYHERAAARLDAVLRPSEDAMSPKRRRTAPDTMCAAENDDDIDNNCRADPSSRP